MTQPIYDGPLEITTQIVDGWLTVVTATGDWEESHSEGHDRLKNIVADENSRWMLLNAGELAFGLEWLVGDVDQMRRAVRSRGGGFAIVCTGQVRRLMDGVFNGTDLNVCGSIDEAEDLLATTRRRVDLEVDALLPACRVIPPSYYSHVAGDYLSILMMAVLDLQIVTNHFEFQYRSEPHDHRGLKDLLSRYADDPEGNQAVAQYLWNSTTASKVQVLRQLVAFLDAVGVSDLDTLREAAEYPSFARHLLERVPSLTRTAYGLMRLRLGLPVSTPTRQIRKFFEGIGTRPMEDDEMIIMTNLVAGRLGIPPAELHWRIWQSRQGRKVTDPEGLRFSWDVPKGDGGLPS